MIKVQVSAIILFLAASSANAGKWSAGPVAIIQAHPYIGGDNGTMLIPAVAYEGERLSVRGPFVEYKAWDSKRGEPSLAFTLGLGANELEVDGDARLAGIQDRDSGFLAGLRYTMPALYGEFSTSIQADISNKSDGLRVSIGWDKPLITPRQNGWLLSAGVTVEYANSDYADYYFGVSNTEADVSNFAGYEVGSYVQPALTIGGFYSFNKSWQLVYNLEWQILASDVKDSPIVDKSVAASGVVGVVYNF